jgi:hypothetical protein
MRLRLIAVLPALLLTVALAREVSAEVSITVDKSSQRMIVEVDGQRRYSWPVSTGTNGYDTPGGSYRPFRMERDHRSKEWDDAPMPHAIFFTRQGHAIHGTNRTRQLGRPASHGCVRLSPRHAAALYSLVTAQGMANTRVVVKGSEPVVAQRKGEGGFRMVSRKRQEISDGIRPVSVRQGQVARDSYGAVRPRLSIPRQFEQIYTHGYAEGYSPAYGYE